MSSPASTPQPLAVSTVVTVGVVLGALGLGLVVLGAALFPPLREDGWLVGAAIGSALAAVMNVGLRVRRGTAEQRFAWRVLGGLLSPGLLGLGVGGVLVLNGALDRGAPVARDVAASKVRRSNVEGDDAPREDVLVDVDDWQHPGVPLTLRFPQAPALSDGTLHLVTHPGAFGIEWRRPEP